MATTRGKGGTGSGAAGKTPARRTRTRAPEDDISGVAAPEGPPAKRTRKAAPGPGVADAKPAAKAAKSPAGKRGGARETYAETAARRRKDKEVDRLAMDLRAFAIARPSGWNHDDWVLFLEYLASQGHDVSDADGIGRRLEQERLGISLGGVPGLGPRRVQSLVDRFGSLWSMRHAGADDVAAVPGMTRPLAQRLVEDLRTRYP